MNGFGAIGAKATSGAIPVWTLGDRLRKARELASIGQVEFSKMTDIARSSIVRYEGDVSVPRRHVLLVWAMATGVNLEWLETGTAPVPEGTEAVGDFEPPAGIDPATFSLHGHHLTLVGAA